MSIHIDEKENFKKKIDKLKDDIARQNKEIQNQKKKQKKPKKKWENIHRACQDYSNELS